ARRLDGFVRHRDSDCLSNWPTHRTMVARIEPYQSRATRTGSTSCELDGGQSSCACRPSHLRGKGSECGQAEWHVTNRISFQVHCNPGHFGMARPAQIVSL